MLLLSLFFQLIFNRYNCPEMDCNHLLNFFYYFGMLINE